MIVGLPLLATWHSISNNSSVRFACLQHENCERSWVQFPQRPFFAAVGFVGHIGVSVLLTSGRSMGLWCLELSGSVAVMPPRPWVYFEGCHDHDSGRHACVRL
ncbi:hypothetical protein BDU57DRAFT_365668 [Ampelomyces quisqualis]|uniref:Uncharacterized protein n=1 Tax=Ampelomyces quisqualis TaxID=50730 RepID=A0A6A5QAP6_AMPQU|nr:hypothetical protein BDU57DRAFT_365668 [Ampelomyces quisqualis]